MTTSRAKASKAQSEVVTFKFYNMQIDNVPFYHKTLSLKVHFRMNSYSTDATPVENFMVKWNKVLEFQRNITPDASMKPSPSIVEIRIYAHSLKRGRKNETANAKLDLAQLLRTRTKHVVLELQSNILESHLQFDVEIQGGEAFKENVGDVEDKKMPELPKIVLFKKNSWFTFKDDPDLIEKDANELVEAAISTANR